MQVMIHSVIPLFFFSFFSVIDGPMDKKQPAPDVEHCFSNTIEKHHGIKILFLVKIF